MCCAAPGKACPDLSLDSWLTPDEFDLYAVGAQEVEAAPGMSADVLLLCC
jgi:hypothetical protein